MEVGDLTVERLPGAQVVSGRGVRAAFTGRDGPVRGRFGGTNLSRTVGDDETAVVAAREWAAGLAGLAAADVAWGYQVHGARVRRVDGSVRGRGPLAPSLPETDALVSATPGVGVGVLAADCLPVLLVGAATVGVAHAGWKGLVAGVLEATVVALGELRGGAAPAAVIGPAIGPCCFDVGPDVARLFADRWPETVVTGPGGRPHVDLGGAAARVLLAAGATSVDFLGPCTLCGAAPAAEPYDGAAPAAEPYDGAARAFFSHRSGDVGRQALVAGVVDA